MLCRRLRTCAAFHLRAEKTMSENLFTRIHHARGRFAIGSHHSREGNGVGDDREIFAASTAHKEIFYEIRKTETIRMRTSVTAEEGAWFIYSSMTRYTFSSKKLGQGRMAVGNRRCENDRCLNHHPSVINHSPSSRSSSQFQISLFADLSHVPY